jgi:hypothetical protein
VPGNSIIGNKREFFHVQSSQRTGRVLYNQSVAGKLESGLISQGNHRASVLREVGKRLAMHRQVWLPAECREPPFRKIPISATQLCKEEPSSANYCDGL